MPPEVLVTGATGFIGGHLVPRLLDEGYRVACLTRQEETVWGERVRLVRGDITSLEDMTAATRGVDTVFHLAGLVSYRSADFKKQIEINVEGTRNVLEAALKNGVRRVVHASSVAAYGVPEPKGRVADESFVYNLEGRNLSYCDTKYAAEQVVRDYHRKGLNVVMLNPGIVFGEGDSHAHHHAIFKNMSKGVMVVPSGGIPFSDIKDVIEAFIQAIDRGIPGERHTLVSANLTFIEAAKIFASIYGCKEPLATFPDWLVALAGLLSEGLYTLGVPTRVTRQQAWLSCQCIFFDSERAARELGFSATPFAETIKRTAPFYLGKGYVKRA